jgi:hypothetical protein
MNGIVVSDAGPLHYLILELFYLAAITGCRA